MKYRDYRNRTYASQIAVAPRIQLIPKFSDIKYEWPTADLRHTLGHMPQILEERAESLRMRLKYWIRATNTNEHRVKHDKPEAPT